MQSINTKLFYLTDAKDEIESLKRSNDQKKVDNEKQIYKNDPAVLEKIEVKENNKFNCKRIRKTNASKCEHVNKQHHAEDESVNFDAEKMGMKMLDAAIKEHKIEDEEKDKCNDSSNSSI